ncbi:hypothetical protein BS50DRAFT_678943 [Corynespora cassiicola Philippines]|uniref:Uncharacterized protein n=1 Tax=Corynespora cassiicola Philippines TaxID=1448308 RepID=A0A2T2NF77_CORCC|nr:hypothetical protein BS50DRAFT_678943 [Corynespora cassiicola Philippines]
MKPKDLLLQPGGDFHSPRITRSYIVSYLKQYRLYHWRAASHGKLPDNVPKASPTDIPTDGDYDPDRLEEDDELMMARLRKAQVSLKIELSKLKSDLKRWGAALTASRKKTWARTGIVSLIAGMILAVIFDPPHRGTHIPGLLQWLVPLVPVSIGVFSIAAKENQISRIAAAEARLDDLEKRISSLYPITSLHIEWIGSEKWII